MRKQRRETETHSRVEKADHFRLLHRCDSQAGQHMNIHRTHHVRMLYNLYMEDLFHTLVDLPKRALLPLVATVYMLAFSILAWLFWLINDTCDLGMSHPVEAFAFSVETWLTIGYGLPDHSPGPYLKDCWSGVAIITVQGIAGLLLNAFLVGLVITHVSSGDRRGCTVLFSEKAVIREVGGRLYFMMQVCEMRHSQLLEAHVRAYVIRRPLCPAEGPVDAPQVFEMRLSRPDDETGGMVLPVLPTVIVHEIDSCSPLAPPAPEDAMNSRHWARPLVRTADALSGGRSSVWCSVCGEQFPNRELLEAHQEYQAEQDELAGAKRRPHQPPKRSGAEEGCQVGQTPDWRQQVKTFQQLEWFEVVCILEGAWRACSRSKGCV